MSTASGQGPSPTCSWWTQLLGGDRGGGRREQLHHLSPHLSLLDFDIEGPIHHPESLCRGHALVLLDYPGLEYPVTLVLVVGEVEVHPRLVVLQLGPPRQYSLHRCLD